MIETQHVSSDLPALDRTDDPRGGAAAWALITVSAPLLVTTILAVFWLW
ncbi:MAG: hypothetical protein ACRDS0_07070 [Pseudonocardiaceae bacterium]